MNAPHKAPNQNESAFAETVVTPASARPPAPVRPKQRRRAVPEDDGVDLVIGEASEVIRLPAALPAPTDPRDRQRARTLEIARREGWTIIPVRERSKAPARDGWQHTTREAGWRQIECHQGNLGLLLGDPSKVVDIDLDDPVAVIVAARILSQPLAIFGRKGKLRSHFLYRCPAPKGTSNRDGVELRATGGHTVMPGSLHKDTGDLIEWEQIDDNAPARSWEDLCALVDLIRLHVRLARDGLLEELARIPTDTQTENGPDLGTIPGPSIVLGPKVEVVACQAPATVAALHRYAHDHGRRNPWARSVGAFLLRRGQPPEKVAGVLAAFLRAYRASEKEAEREASAIVTGAVARIATGVWRAVRGMASIAREDGQAAEALRAAMIADGLIGEPGGRRLAEDPAAQQGFARLPPSLQDSLILIALCRPGFACKYRACPYCSAVRAKLVVEQVRPVWSSAPLFAAVVPGSVRLARDLGGGHCARVPFVDSTGQHHVLLVTKEPLAASLGALQSTSDPEVILIWLRRALGSLGRLLASALRSEGRHLQIVLFWMTKRSPRRSSRGDLRIPEDEQIDALLIERAERKRESMPGASPCA